MWFDGWALRRVQSAAPNFFWKKKNNCREFVRTQDNRVRRPRSLARSLATPKTKTHPQNTKTESRMEFRTLATKRRSPEDSEARDEDKWQKVHSIL
jgi:hypothetical protein